MGNHVDQWRRSYLLRASEDSEKRERGERLRNRLLDEWFEHRWSTNLHGIEFTGSLSSVDELRFVDDAVVNPRFTIEFDDERGYPMTIGGHFANFHLVRDHG